MSTTDGKVSTQDQKTGELRGDLWLLDVTLLQKIDNPLNLDLYWSHRVIHHISWFIVDIDVVYVRAVIS